MIKLVSDTIDRQDINALVEWLSQDEIPRLTKGGLTIELEKKWAKKIRTKYSVFVNSGSSSILLTLAALKYSDKLRNNKIIVPALSWATDVSSPMLLGYETYMCDCNLEDLSCDLEHLEKLFKEHKPSTFILVSPLGLVPDMNKIVELCNRYDVLLLEDVCESMGSKYQNKYLGSFGLASFYSMYFGHHLSTIEGGFINTNDEDLYHLLLMIRSHGWDRDLPKDKQKELRDKYKCTEFNSLYNFYVPGMNVRSTDLQAFIGLRAIKKLDDYSKRRRINFKHYVNLIKNNELELKENKNDFVSSFAIPILHSKRDEIIKELQDKNIEVRPLIAGNMANKPMWYNENAIPSLPNCESLDKSGFYIPNHQDLTYSEIQLITNIINKYE
jgi:CDP-6-deoxy-D-xylo-4-hexulose-3-dehydrase|tara:strand:- start:15084 stop:16238 length:1155 start_codon:yes stop_codon:yes gene_type:complete